MEVLARGPVHEAYADSSNSSTATPLVTKNLPDGIEEFPRTTSRMATMFSGFRATGTGMRIEMTSVGSAVFGGVCLPGRVWVPGSCAGQRVGRRLMAMGAGVLAGSPRPTTSTTGSTAAGSSVSPRAAGNLGKRPGRSSTDSNELLHPRKLGFGELVAMSGGRANGLSIERAGCGCLHTFAGVRSATFMSRDTGTIHSRLEGVLYAPVAYPTAIYTQPGYVYTPSYVVSDQCMMGAMFVRRGWGCYYFGDYYGPQYATGGYSAWCGTVGANGAFVVGFGVGARWGYDPLWSYYSVAYRGSPAWTTGMGDLYVGRFRGTIAAPPVTLVQQNVVINRVTNVTVVNVTNNFTVVNRSITVNNVNVSGLAMVAPTRIVVDMHPEMRIQPLPMAARQEERVAARQMREVAANRMRHENEVIRRGGGIPKSAEAVHSMKLEVPKAAVARAQVMDEKKAPPASPHKVEEHLAPKVDPKGPLTPKIDPKGPAKIDPKGPAKTDPKRDPKDGRP